jgi:hemolysin activation/secretion protein
VDDFRGANQAALEVRQGLPILNANESDDPENSRLDGTGVFTLVRGEASRLQDIGWNFTAFAAVGAQYSADNLLPFELFRVGGPEFGRGYDPSQLTGDHGVGATFELQYHGTLDWDDLDEYQVFGFYDFGQVWVNDDGRSGLSLASAGGGVRARFTDWLDAELTVAKPLTRDSQRSEDGQGRSPQVLFRVVGSF